MENVIKLSEDELNSIASIQNDYNKVVYELGQIDIAKEELIKQTESLTTKRADLYNKLLEMRETEKSLITSITSKYGDGTLNYKEGTFKPSKQPEK